MEDQIIISVQRTGKGTPIIYFDNGGVIHFVSDSWNNKEPWAWVSIKGTVLYRVGNENREEYVGEICDYLLRISNDLKQVFPDKLLKHLREVFSEATNKYGRFTEESIKIISQRLNDETFVIKKKKQPKKPRKSTKSKK